MDKLLNEISHDDYLFRVDDYLPSAWIGHAPFLKFLIREMEPKKFVELGVHNGFSYFLACQAIYECGLSTEAFAVDHWIGDDQAGFFDEKVFQKVTTLNEKYSNFSNLLRMSFAAALENFNESSIDLLHIDGFHSFESVKEDFESWLGKMKPNGIILLHDIYVRRDTFGVYKFWSEVKKNYKVIEFVGSHGLGVVFLGEVPEGKLGELYRFFKAGDAAAVQGAFGSISDDVIQAAANLAVVERDKAFAERDQVVNSRIWKFFQPYRNTRKRITIK